MAQREILIVANETAAGGHLRHLVATAAAEEPTRFTLIIPATPPPGGGMWTEAQARELAAARLRPALDVLRTTGAEIRGLVGAPRAFDAVYDAFLEGHYDAVIVSTLPHGVSRWLQQRLPQQIRRRFGVPVTHVLGSAASDERRVAS